jgi:hypothetical protein
MHSKSNYLQTFDLHVDYNPLKGMLVIKLLFYISDRCVLLFSVVLTGEDNLHVVLTRALSANVVIFIACGI